MTTYDTITTTIPDDLEKRIIEILKGHVGKNHSIERDYLCHLLFHASGMTPDRQMRLAIANIRKNGIAPILSDSGNGGYWWGTPEECEAFTREQASRIAHEAAIIAGIRKAARLAPLQARVMEEVEQPQLFDLPVEYQ